MITMQITVEVKDDRQVFLTLPPEVPTGQTELVVTVSPRPAETKKPRTSLAEWAEANAKGNSMNENGCPATSKIYYQEDATCPFLNTN